MVPLRAVLGAAGALAGATVVVGASAAASMPGMGVQTGNACGVLLAVFAGTAESATAEVSVLRLLGFVGTAGAVEGGGFVGVGRVEVLG